MMVLDSSAVVALLRKEPGADLVKPELATGLMSSVNYAEVLGRFERDKVGRGLLLAVQLRNALQEVVPFGLSHAAHAASLVSHTVQFGLSLGDRCCLALAIDRKCAVLTADRIWLQLKLFPPVEIKSIR